MEEGSPAPVTPAPVREETEEDPVEDDEDRICS